MFLVWWNNHEPGILVSFRAICFGNASLCTNLFMETLKSGLCVKLRLKPCGDFWVDGKCPQVVWERRRWESSDMELYRHGNKGEGGSGWLQGSRSNKQLLPRGSGGFCENWGSFSWAMLLKKTYAFNCVRFPAQILHFYTWLFQCPFGEMFFVLRLSLGWYYKNLGNY